MATQWWKHPDGTIEECDMAYELPENSGSQPITLTEARRELRARAVVKLRSKLLGTTGIYIIERKNNALKTWRWIDVYYTKDNAPIKITEEVAAVTDWGLSKGQIKVYGYGVTSAETIGRTLGEMLGMANLQARVL